MHKNKRAARTLAACLLLCSWGPAGAVLLIPKNLVSGAPPAEAPAQPGGGATVPIAGASIVVNAAQEVSETGGNDIGAARMLFRSASYPESNWGLQSSAALMDGIGTTHSRTINAEDSSYVDAGGAFHPSNRILWNLEWIKRYGYNAHVIVGQRQPAFITPSASQWGPQEWHAYEDYATRFVRYVALQYDDTGFPETLFEVGNEIDITQDVRDLWTLAQPAVPQGDGTRYQHYLRVFEVWSRAVDRVAREHPGRSVKIAGPALGGQSLFLGNDFWHERFIEDVARRGLRLDMVTHHFYGDILRGWQNVPGSGLRQQLRRIRNALVAHGRAALPIAITEYGPSEGSDNVFGRINYSHESAAWSAAFVHEALAGTATSGSYLLVRDNFGANPTGVPTVASLTHIREGVDYPKPNYNAFRMFAMLPGTRKAVAYYEQHSDVKAIASADASAAGLVVYNYNFRFNWPSDNTDLTAAQAVTPAFANLSFSGPVTVERYLVDRETSNIARYLDAGEAPDHHGTMLARVETCTATVSGGTLALPARVLGPSAVSLWIVRSGGGDSAPCR